MKNTTKVLKKIMGWVFTACIFVESYLTALLGLMFFKPGHDLRGAEPIFYVVMGYYILSSLLATPFITGCAGQKLTGVKKGLYAIIGAAAWLAGVLVVALPQLIR